ncbi:hypothetical protein BXZ70DRAFT_934341 [Cristinia sonorae]|uniref:ABM domain-containing protein n=1 Tax=Cristinia sonorae TaxID=1940300 RepID=A0A8K0XQA8_9AGAR|nr:hypothetical protein BXZ70DRAFT_934341 [Cristinia sonorae]
MGNPDVYIEIAHFESTRAYRDDPSIIQTPLEMIGKAKNLYGIWTGLQVEDQQTLYMAVVWKSVEDHYAYMADKELWNAAYQAYLSSAFFDITACGGLLHIQFNTDPYVHLNKPVTEFMRMELMAGRQSEAIEGILRQELAEREALLKEQGPSRGLFTWGCAWEFPEMFVIMTGWDSVEDSEAFREQYAAQLEKFAASLKAVGDCTVARYQFTKFES